MTHVIVPDYPTRVQFTIGASPGTGPFGFNFTFFATVDIDVYLDAALATEGTHYTVAGNPGREGGYEGGSVTLLSARSNIAVTIQRNMPIERVSDFPVAGSFNRQTLNSTLDKQVAMIQQVDERVDRAFTLPPSSPPLVLSAGYFPRVNAAATGMDLISPLQVQIEIGAQPLEPTLTALAALPPASAGKFIWSNGPESFAFATISAQGMALLDDPDAATMRSTLALGTMATQNSNAVNITGGTISGVAVAVPGLGTMSTQNANAVAITGGAITGMPQPVNPFDVATKNYADNLAFGVNKRSTVRVSSTAPVTLSTIGNGSVLDGVALASGDRILIKDQTNHAQNGVYLVGATATSLRAADFDTYDECPGSLVTVQEGTVNQDTVWLCVSNAGGILDTTPIDFTKVKVSPTIPVIIGEGGTGSTTALAAFDALKQPASTGYVGAIQLATQAEVDAGANTVKAVVPATLAARLTTGAGTRHDCRFFYLNSTTVTLQRYGGSQITIDGKLETIPAGGVNLTYSSGWGAAGTVHHVYVQMVGGVMTLVPDTPAPVADPRDGNLVHPTYSYLTIVGLMVVGYGTFIDDGTHLGVLSFWNRRGRYLQAGVGGVTSGSTGPVIVAALATNALNWVDETIRIMFAGYASNNTPSQFCAVDLYYDSNSLACVVVAHSTSPGIMVNQTTVDEVILVQGWHSIAPYVYVSGGGGTWYGRFTVATRG